MVTITRGREGGSGLGALQSSLRELLSRPRIAEVIWKGDVRERLEAAIREDVGPDACRTVCDESDAIVAGRLFTRLAYEFSARSPNYVNVRRNVEELLKNRRILDEEAYLASVSSLVRCALQVLVSSSTNGTAVPENLEAGLGQAEEIVLHGKSINDPERVVDLRGDTFKLLQKCVNTRLSRGHEAMMQKVASGFTEPCITHVDNLKACAERMYALGGAGGNHSSNTGPSGSGEAAASRKRMRGVPPPAHEPNPAAGARSADDEDSASNGSEAEGEDDGSGSSTAGASGGVNATAGGGSVVGEGSGTGGVEPMHTTTPAPGAQRTQSAVTVGNGGVVRVRERKYPCDKCTKSFKSRSHLTRHVSSVHHKLRPYACMVAGCSKNFTQKEHLKEHISSVHNKVKPFGCPRPGCKQRFARKEAVAQHVDTVHDKLKPHQCDICGKCFGQRSAVLGHKRAVHKNTDAAPGAAVPMVHTAPQPTTSMAHTAPQPTMPVQTCNAQQSHTSNALPPQTPTPTPAPSETAAINAPPVVSASSGDLVNTAM